MGYRFIKDDTHLWKQEDVRLKKNHNRFNNPIRSDVDTITGCIIENYTRMSGGCKVTTPRFIKNLKQPILWGDEFPVIQQKMVSFHGLEG